MMEVVSYVRGISGRNFAMDEVQPIRGAPFTTFANSVRTRYGFQNAGMSTEAQEKGIASPVFEIGEYLLNGVPHTISGLELNLDGLRATAYTTEIADAFIVDLLDFAKATFGYRIETISKPAVYGSAVLVRLDERELSFFSFLHESCQILQDELKTIEKSLSVKPFGVRLIAKADDSIKSGAMYVLEKRAGNEAGDDIYFSQAPLPTISHERFLRRLFPRPNSTPPAATPAPIARSR